VQSPWFSVSPWCAFAFVVRFCFSSSHDHLTGATSGLPFSTTYVASSDALRIGPAAGGCAYAPPTNLLRVSPEVRHGERAVVSQVLDVEISENGTGPFDGLRCGCEHGQNVVPLTHRRLVVLVRHALFRP
jgi:hypothetical protein